jgi:hypothetical protein
VDAEVFVFTAPNRTARENRARTLDRPVPLSEIRPLGARAASSLERMGLEEVRCWGSLPGPVNRRTWNRMRLGDWGLLYDGEGRFPLLLRVGLKAEYVRLARHLWGEDEQGKTWKLMFFFDAVRQLDLGLAEVRDAFGYEDDWWPRGLQYPDPAKQAALLDKFGSLEAFASSAPAGPARIEVGAALSAEELLFGGHFGGVPSRPPQARRQRREPDPDISGRGYMAHQLTVAKLEEHVGRLAFHIGTRGVNHDGAWTAAGEYCICEVKSITADNEVDQLQKGLGQVLHNRFKAKWNGVEGVKAYLVAEREPSNGELWLALCAEHDVVFTWPERFAEDVRGP